MHHHETFPAVFVKGKLVRTCASSAPPKMSLVHRWVVATTPMRSGRLGNSRRCLRIEFYALRACVCTRRLSGNMNNCAFMNFYFPAHLCGGRVASPQKLETFRAHTLVYHASQTKHRQNMPHMHSCIQKMAAMWDTMRHELHGRHRHW